MIRIAIQGEVGSFHDMASHRYFEGEDIELICCNTFEDVFAAIKADPEVVGMVAMCLPSDDWDQITEVNSHPVALMQCREFLKHHPRLKIVEVDDTAGAAKNISQNGLHGHAAICSKAVADIYGMKVLEEGIETNKHNFTRFLVVCKPEMAPALCSTKHINKASIVFTLAHTEGQLSQVLSIFSFYKINLTKIQSLPIIGREWEYMFYVDITFDDYQRYRQSIEATRPLTTQITILGEYENGKSTV